MPDYPAERDAQNAKSSGMTQDRKKRDRHSHTFLVACPPHKVCFGRRGIQGRHILGSGCPTDPRQKPAGTRTSGSLRMKQALACNNIQVIPECCRRESRITDCPV
jgi:hypothetical protein